MFEDLLKELDRDRSSPFAQFADAVLTDLSVDDLGAGTDAETLEWMRLLLAALDAR